MSTDRMTRQIDKAIRNRISSLKLRVSSAVGLKFIVDEKVSQSIYPIIHIHISLTCLSRLVSYINKSN
ncbi:BnaCnng24880D [Brassica napus]|uniref:(rape) hypothetical protein n=1 Tax=Brassica napus TaxID=3708 RepID=A0A078IU08_BRANA|nr:unnamed protein product [Brassica napus]CDY53326.1 BnaCnng24880D [Brassica napus]